MAILTRTKLYPNERYDLEDFLAEQSASRTESLLYTKELLSGSNHIVKGFTVTGVGLTQLTLQMADATLIVPESTSDFSYFISSPSQADITISASSLTVNTRNYLEIYLATLDGTPVNRAFWDPNANSGLGQEFNQTVNTMTDVVVTPVVLTGGFSGLPDRIQIAAFDVDINGNVKTLFDRRELYRRLSKPENLNYTYDWGTKQEPAYTLVLSGVTGTFLSGELLSINTETATCVTGGNSTITFNSPSGINFFPGSSVTGQTSGATASVGTITESFTGVDKSLLDSKSEMDAIKTEILKMKGSAVDYWWQDAPASLSALDAFQDSLLVQAQTGTDIYWDGNNMSILNTNSGSPEASDVLGYIRILGETGTLGLCRQDGTGGSSVIALAEQQVLYVQIPTSGSVSYSGVGSGASNYQITTLTSFSQSTSNFWIAYRENGLLYVRGAGVLQAGGITPLGGASGTGSGSGVQTVTCFDPYDTSLPTGTSAVIDGHTVADGDLVVFTNLSSGTNNRVYKVGGVGSSLTWTAQSFFNGQLDPASGDLIEVLDGSNYSGQIGTFNGTTWTFNDVVRHFNSDGDFWEQTSIKTLSIPANANGTIVNISSTSIQNLIMHYSLVFNSNKEIGLLFLTQNGTDISVTTSGGNQGLCEVTFSAAYDGSGGINITYTSGSQTGLIKYWMEYWSDTAGGPNGIPNYPVYQNVQIGSLNSCYAMSDGSGTQINCSAPTVVDGVTQLTFDFTYTVGVAPGATTGELEVIVDGEVLPRYVSGATVDAYYTEVSDDTIAFWTDLTATPVSIEVRRRQGTINTDVSGNPRLKSYYDIVVGSADQVANGSADYDTISGAVAGASEGQKILVLQGRYVEDVTLTQGLTIEGKGYGTEVQGTFTFNTSFCLVSNLFFNGDIDLESSSVGNIITGCWISSDHNVNDSGTSNLYLNLTDGG